MKTNKVQIGLCLLSFLAIVQSTLGALPTTVATETVSFGDATSVVNIGGIAVTVIPGSYSSGWMENNEILGSAQGVWDLGVSGKMQLELNAGLISATNRARFITLRVVEWDDGGIYSTPVGIVMNGSQVLSNKTISTGLARINATASMGSWVARETQWSLPAGSANNLITVTGADSGSLVNEVSLTSSIVGVVSYPELTISIVQDRALVSWPANGINFQLESSPDLKNWSNVSASVQTDAGIKSVTLNRQNSQQFFRLR